MIPRLLLSLWLFPALPLGACPWCAVSPVMKPTVFEGEPDPGGKFFGDPPDPARVKRYFIAAENEIWDFLPEGKDVVLGNPIPPQIEASPKSPKKRFHQYTDGSFTTRVLPTERLGIMGPVMRGVTGDFIVVTLLNWLSAPVSLHPHGVRYDKDSEGSSYLTARGLGSSIAPQAKFTYVWHLDAASAPRPDEPSSKPWLYHSHVLGDEEINAGLSGFIVVTDAARARPDGTPNDVDREMALLLENYDESGVSEAQEYAGVKLVDGKSPDGGPPPPVTPWPEAQEIKQLAMRHALNGRLFGNLKGLEMVNGERVRWYLFALGIDADVHTAHWHGERLRDPLGHMADVVELMPGTMKCADMLADNPGDWMIHCHVGDHMMEGMYANYTVLPKDGRAPAGEPFYGMAAAVKSVDWQAAAGELAPANFHLKLKCRVTSYANLPLWNTRLGVAVGKLKAQTRLDKSGLGGDRGAKFKVLNGDPSGVVQSDRLEVEITLSGLEWAAVIQAQLKDPAGGSLSLGVWLDDTVHPTQIPLKISGTKLLLNP
ncbi:multicopper oxidase domain-containing protein [bacterium]|nr:multicopper oxidase domain-containing protein [bacterium]